MDWYEVTRKYKTMIVLLLVLLLFLPIIYLVGRDISRSGKIAVTVDVVPYDASLTIDGHKTNIGTVYLKPGNHTVKANKTGFANTSYTTYIDDSRKIVAVSLDPISEEAKQWAQIHQADYDHLDVLGEQSAQESGKVFNDRNPIAVKLPYRTYLYTIGYRADPSDPSGNSIILVIDAPEGYKQSALYQIRQLGYDPTDFKIEFKDYENPFSL